MKKKEEPKEHNQMLINTFSCLVFLILAWVLDKFLQPPYQYIVYVFYAVSYFLGGYKSAKDGFLELLKGKVSIDMLMILGAFGAAFVGEYPEGAVLLFLFSLSGALEHLVLGKTRRAIEELMDIAPERATLIKEGQEVLVAVDSLKKEDLILVRPGERVAGDGVIVEGSTSIDESVINGESLPSDKIVGSDVLAGTLNINGAIKVKLTKDGTETVFLRILNLVEEAQSGKASSQNFTHWFGEKYTLVVISVTTLAFIFCYFYLGMNFHDAFYKAMTLLVVSSPCAVVISIPAAILSAIAGAARRGILFKGGLAIENLAKINAIAFDKTGTLTVGRPEVVEIYTENISENELLSIAAAVENLSEHPLAQAIVSEARKRALVFENASEVRAVVGKGIVAESLGKKILIGKRDLFETEKLTLSVKLLEKIDEFSSSGKSSVIIGVDNVVIGAIALADTLRKSAKESLEKLKAMKIKEMILLTGDNYKVGKSIADTLSMDVKADLLPEDKLVEIKKLIDKYTVVGMMGDGINDAPALAGATLGISLGGNGTDVALETADIVLMGDDLNKLPKAIEIARRAKSIILQNLIIAFSVMIVLILSLIFRDIKLPFAVAGHEGSTVLVILNGIRLLRA